MLRIHLPIMERDKKEESKRGEAFKYIIGCLRGGLSPLFLKSLPFPLARGRG
jgi:hypothetical protein